MQSGDINAPGSASALDLARMVTVPECPYDLAEAGTEWWDWAWKTTAASKWDDGARYTVARRAHLEDHLAALTFTDKLDLADLFSGPDDRDAIRNVEWALDMLKRSASGASTLMKEMRELETQLGLGPKAMAGLGWKAEEPKRDELDALAARRAQRRNGGAAS